MIKNCITGYIQAFSSPQIDSGEGKEEQLIPAPLRYGYGSLKIRPLHAISQGWVDCYESRYGYGFLKNRPLHAMSQGLVHHYELQYALHATSQGLVHQYELLKRR